MYSPKDNAFSNRYITLILQVLRRILARNPELRVRIPLRTQTFVLVVLLWQKHWDGLTIARLSTYSYNFHVTGGRMSGCGVEIKTDGSFRMGFYCHF